MTAPTLIKSFGKSVREFWHALLLIIPITFSYFLFMIKNRALPPEKKSELFWNMGAKNMDNYAENEGLKKLERIRTEKLKKYLTGKSNVLDYGCGTGTIAVQFSNLVTRMQGIDYAAGMIEAAQRKAAVNRIENASFIKTTIFDERLDKGSYDVVIAWGILHLVDDRKHVIDRIYELLKPGGLFLSATECLGEKKTSITSFLALLMKIGIFPIMLKYFSITELESTITGAHFQIIEKVTMADNPVSCFIAAKKLQQ